MNIFHIMQILGGGAGGFAPQAVNGQKQTSCRGRPLESKSTGNFIGPFAQTRL